MEEVEIIHGLQLKDVRPELIDRIQSFLPVEELARTCVLSKSWLQIWLTTPTLRFRPPKSNQQLIRYTDLINRTLKRYHRDNLPITSFDLHFRVINQESIPFVNKWVHTVASRSSLKELYLRIYVLQESISLPDELFLGKNLDTISLKADDPYFSLFNSIYISDNVVIKCVNLRVLEFIDVTLSDETLVKLLSTCILLEKINLSKCGGLRIIKVRNLHHLRELNITPVGYDLTSEIYDVPSLHIFKHYLWRYRNNLLSNSLASVRKLVLKGYFKDDAYSYVISKFPFLDSLSLDIRSCNLNMLDITSVSLKRLIVYMSYGIQIDIKVYAPKLDNIHYKGKSAPGLLFPSIPTNEIELTLELFNHTDRSFFLKTRELLNLSTNFKIKITTGDNIVSFNDDILNMRLRIKIPAMNVKLLTFNSFYLDKGLWERPRLLLETFFSVMRPRYLTVDHPGIRGPLKLIARELMELKTRKYWTSLKKVKIKNRIDEKWITVTSSWITSPEGLACLDYYCGNFELTWRSL